MILRQTLKKAVAGYWDGGAKQTFDWSIEPHSSCADKTGRFVKVGSWGANHWFHVAEGKSDKQTLSYAKKHLQAITRVPIESFEYIDDKGVL